MERLEVRLDTHTKRRLEEWAHVRHISLGKAVRQIIQERLGTPRPSLDKAEAVHQLLSIRLAHVPPPGNLEAEMHRACEAVSW